MRSLKSWPLVILALTVAFAAFAACGDDDDPTPSASSTTVVEAEPDPEADPDPEAEAPGAITPAPPPSGATQVDVTLREWQVESSAATVPPGQVYFRVTNEGPEDAHEFVVIRSDLAPDGLPVDEGAVPEDDVDLLDEIEPFEVGSTGSLTLNLRPGAYVLICNIAEEEEGEIESHYQLGMRTALTVE